MKQKKRTYTSIISIGNIYRKRYTSIPNNRNMKKVQCFIILIFILSRALPFYGEEIKSTSTATLPLDEILTLYREIEKSKSLPENNPPVNAVIHSIDIKGQLLEEAVDIQATIRVHILKDKEWIAVPLFEIDNTTSISVLPEIHNAFLTHLENKLSLVTEKQGTYTFTISFLKKAGKKGTKTSINIAFEKAAQSVLRLRFDENYFTLGNNNIHTATSDGVLLYPDNNIYHLEWEYKKKITHKKSDREQAVHQEVESMIKKAYASAVSTLEGKMIIRIFYELHFTGEKVISFSIPEMYTIEKVYTNKILRTFSMEEGNILTVNVEPKRSGDQTAEVELVMSFNQGNYLLSGTLDLRLPGITWPVHEMYFITHLPEVFDYTYKGGSLTVVDSAPQPDYTYNVPEPGKKLYFHQYLITSSSPSVTLDYTINLDGNFFLATGW